ncbi:hypothetical protein MTR67_042287 [Solanum verrucosum]|uniref:EF-hand domain-containing protein n=1 Tax=Solanum verrucosum TaxID=315347 RepID=A0AAF0ZR04_SOLVR|nr:hypothetical protein MTR67_042287 [Solanum verrucosum]
MKIRSRKLYRDKDYKTDEVIEEFDLDDDGMINMDEFVKGFTRWIDETKDAMGSCNLSPRQIDRHPFVLYGLTEHLRRSFNRQFAPEDVSKLLD